MRKWTPCEKCGKTILTHLVTPKEARCDSSTVSSTFTARDIVEVYETLGRPIPRGLMDRYNKEKADGR